MKKSRDSAASVVKKSSTKPIPRRREVDATFCAMSCSGALDDFSATRVGTAGRIAFRDRWNYLKANRSYFDLLKGQPELHSEFTSVM
jgi:hypothetical protein